MTKKIRQVIKRIENELVIHGVGTMSSQYGQFIDDVLALVTYIKKQRRAFKKGEKK